MIDCHYSDRLFLFFYFVSLYGIVLGLPEEFKGRRRKSFGQKDGDDASSRYEEKEKIVLEGIMFTLL